MVTKKKTRGASETNETSADNLKKQPKRKYEEAYFALGFMVNVVGETSMYFMSENSGS